jgi:predicted TIM-barrel fold metal-dependent hydrolase
VTTQELLRPIPPLREVRQHTWHPPAGVKIISTDDHNLEPLHLWEERLPAKWKDKAPKLYRDAHGALALEAEGKELLPKGINEDVSGGLPGYWDIGEKIKAMDAEGIDVSFMFHGVTQGLNRLDDKELYAACVEVYNEWLIGYCRPHRDRLVPIAILPAFLRPDAAAEYVQRIQGLGYKALQMPAFPRGVRYNSRSMDPLWEAIQDSGIPLMFHVGPYIEFVGNGSTGANITRNLAPYRGLLAQLVFSGALERHPGLNVVFCEGGATWVAQAIADMDYIVQTYHSELQPKLGVMPSEIWRRQCYASFIVDAAALRLVDLIGEDNIMWGADYPHAEGTWGYTNDMLSDMWKTLGPVAGAKFLGGNAARLWKL